MKLTTALIVLCVVVAVSNVTANRQRKKNRPYSLIREGDVEHTRLERGTVIYKTTNNPLYEPSENLRTEFRRARFTDWKGHYFALDRDVAKNYAFSYTDQATAVGKAYLHAFQVNEPIDVVRVNKATFGNQGSEKEKADAIKNFLHDHPQILNAKSHVFNENEPLVTELNRREYAIQLPHDTEGNYELVIGDKVASKLLKTQTIIVASDGNELTEYRTDDQIPGKLRKLIEKHNPISHVRVEASNAAIKGLIDKDDAARRARERTLQESAAQRRRA